MKYIKLLTIILFAISFIIVCCVVAKAICSALSMISYSMLSLGEF